MTSRQQTALTAALALSAGAVFLGAAAKQQGKIAGVDPRVIGVLIGGAGLLISQARPFS